MSDGTKIEWTDATWNVVNGCSVVSPGCTNCYAMKLAGTRLKHHPSRVGLTQDSKAGPVWNGKVRFAENVLLDPLKWKRPRKIFVCAHGDLFHHSVLDEWIDRVFAVMALCPQHIFQVLTKRPDRMREYVTYLPDTAENVANAAANLMGGLESVFSQIMRKMDEPLPNVWLGTSVEDQKRADERIPDLLATPAAVRFLSCEPLLGPVNLTMLNHDGITNIDALRGIHGVSQPMAGDCAKLDWVIVGGESGKSARPMHPDWARDLRNECISAGVPFFFKQWGEWHPGWNLWPDGVRMIKPGFHFDGGPMYRLGKKATGRMLDLKFHDAMPGQLAQSNTLGQTT